MVKIVLYFHLNELEGIREQTLRKILFKLLRRPAFDRGSRQWGVSKLRLKRL